MVPLPPQVSSPLASRSWSLWLLIELLFPISDALPPIDSPPGWQDKDGLFSRATEDASAQLKFFSAGRPPLQAAVVDGRFWSSAKVSRPGSAKRALSPLKDFCVYETPLFSPLRSFHIQTLRFGQRRPAVSLVPSIRVDTFSGRFFFLARHEIVFPFSGMFKFLPLQIRDMSGCVSLA